jgi:hypothetical protein
MAQLDQVNRRDLLLRPGRRPRIVQLSCERLYMKYMDARAGGCLREFLNTLDRELREADEICLTGREWLAREDFRNDLDPLLRACVLRGARIVS